MGSWDTPHPASSIKHSTEIHPITTHVDVPLHPPIRYYQYFYPQKPVFRHWRSISDLFWLAMAYDIMVTCVSSVLCVIPVILNVQHRLRRHRGNGASRLASHFRFAFGRLHSAELLGVSWLLCHKRIHLSDDDCIYSRVWHQALRKLATGHVDFIAKQLRLQKGSFRTTLKLFMAFFVTGFIHYAAEYVLYPKWAGHSMEFFLLQPVAMTFERTIITLATKAGFSPEPTRFVKFIGFVWVFAWFTYCLPLWLDKVIHSGAMDNGLNYSLVLRLWHGEWRPLQ